MSREYMKNGDIVKFRNAVDAGDGNLRMVLVGSIVDLKIRPTCRYGGDDLDDCADTSSLK